ncbi:MAG: glycosyltransferase, partial [Nitriliruptorales bacterium]|nr:glycosyltransferase [Nitriliruptorales bacterium]
MRVLALTHVFPRSEGDPCAPFLLAWANALRGAGVRIAVVAPHDAGLPIRHHVAGIGVRRSRYAPDGWERLAYRGQMHELVRSPAGPPLAGGLIASLTSAVRAQIRAGRPDVLHVHWWLPGAIVARLARPSIPVVVTVHGTDVALIEARPALAALARWALEGVDRVEAVSTDLAERLEAATGRPADAIGPMPLAAAAQAAAATGASGSGAGSGLKAAGTTGDSERPLRVLAAGRLVPEKGFTDLVEAVARLAAPARLEIVGDGPERVALIQRAAARRVDLHLPGSLPPEELAVAYAGADVVAQPSHREGFGLVAAEALMAGVPVVATDSGGA